MHTWVKCEDINLSNTSTILKHTKENIHITMLFVFFQVIDKIQAVAFLTIDVIALHFWKIPYVGDRSF